MDLETLSESPDWPNNLIGLPVIWRGMESGKISSAEGRRAGGPIVSIKFDASEVFGLTEGEWDFKEDCKFNVETGEWDFIEEDSPMREFKRLPKQESPTRILTLKELGLPVAEDIEEMFWNTNNNEVCKAIESWVKSPDCSGASVSRLARILCEMEEKIRTAKHEGWPQSAQHENTQA